MKSLVRRRFFRPVEGTVKSIDLDLKRVETHVSESALGPLSSEVVLPVNTNLEQPQGGSPERQ